MPFADAEHILVRIRPGVAVTSTEHEITLRFDGRRLLRYRVTDEPLRALLLQLTQGPRSLASILAEASHGPPLGLGRALFLLRRLALTGTLGYAIRVGGDRLLAHVDTVASSSLVLHEATPATGPLRLSRFAYVRRVGDELVLETPLSPVRVRLADPAVLALLWGARGGAICADEGLAGGTSVLVAMLRAARILEDIGESDEADDGSLVSWEFHDLLFHARSRIGRSPGLLGATFRFLGRFDSPPVVRPRDDADGPPIVLARPDLDATRAADPPFTSVLESRVSVRRNGPPIALAQLGELLFRSCRIKKVARRGPDDVSHRVAPGGGARHVLDVYVVARSCEGLAPGLYRYDPLAHALVPRCGGDPRDTADLIEDVRLATGEVAAPQVLLVLGARFRRMAWKYEAMAYATILKDAGALVQTMYLVATAMNLAPCAIGCGDSDLFARAASLSYLDETSVAELALGTLPPEGASFDLPDVRSIETLSEKETSP